MITNDEKTDNEGCIKHLEIILGVPIDEKKIKFAPIKNNMVIEDPKLFHEVAQASGLKELRRGRLSPWYGLRVSESYELVIALDSRCNQDFLTKYGGHYKFR